MNASMNAVLNAAALPKAQFDWKPLLLLAGVATLGLPLIGSPSTWVTLTVAGLAMGLIIFIIASGLTLVFGLMDVLNFGHGVFIATGAFVATSVMGGMGGWVEADNLLLNLTTIFLAMLAAMAVAGALGLAFERVIVRPVYGQHLKQILITMGGMIVGEEIIKVIWGPQQQALPLPTALRGSFVFGDAAIEKYRLLAVVVGLLVFALLLWVLNRTKVGLLVRAGVQDREMVESLGYRIKRLFVGVFAAGSALAGLGGVMWGAVPAECDAADRCAGQRADLHRHHHWRVRQHARLFCRCAAGGLARQLHRLPGAEGGAVLEHRLDGGDPVVAAAGALPREVMNLPR